MESNNKPRVLIVDDMPVNRMILASLLASSNVDSDQAEGGEEAVALYAKNRYDLILLDHRMPEVDGVETLQRIQEIFRHEGRTVPVICHTTEDGQKNESLYLAAGFSAVLTKPIQPQKLSEILLTYLPDAADNKAVLDTDKAERLQTELAALPQELFDIDGLSIASGIEHCETAEDYLNALIVFRDSISEKADEIETFASDCNWQMYVLRVHSLKSMARLCGAEALSDMAAELENAGKHLDIDVIIRDTPALLSMYRSFIEPLSRISADNDARPAAHTLPPISDATLHDAYTAIAEFASCYDAESINMVLESLMEYRLSDADAEKTAEIGRALRQADWAYLRSVEG